MAQAAQHVREGSVVVVTSRSENRAGATSAMIGRPLVVDGGFLS